MQGYHIDAAAHTITVVDVPKRTDEIAAMLETRRGNVGVMPLQCGNNPTELLIVANQPEKGHGAFFLINGLINHPVHGDAIVVGVQNGRSVGTESEPGLMQSDPAEKPSMTLEWLQANIVWLKPAPGHSGDGVLAFEAVDMNPGQILNMLAALKVAQERGDIGVSEVPAGGGDHLHAFTIGGDRERHNDGGEAISKVIKAVKAKLH